MPAIVKVEVCMLLEAWHPPVVTPMLQVGPATGLVIDTNHQKHVMPQQGCWVTVMVHLSKQACGTPRGKGIAGSRQMTSNSSNPPFALL